MGIIILLRAHAICISGCIIIISRASKQCSRKTYTIGTRYGIPNINDQAEQKGEFNEIKMRLYHVASTVVYL